MKKWTMCLLMAVAVTAMGFGFASAAPVVNGSFNVTFYSEPNHAPSATRCVTFTKTGGILNEPLSGTWSSPTLGGGEWIQEGDYFKWYGPQDGAVIMTSGFGTYYTNGQGAGEFVTFNRSTGQTSNAGSWRMSRTSSCPASTMEAPPADVDLTR